MIQKTLKIVPLLFLLLISSTQCFLKSSKNLNHQDQELYLTKQTNLQNNQQNRLLQSANLESAPSTTQLKAKILGILNQKRITLGLSELIINASDQRTLQTWSLNFRSTYTLSQYLTLLRRYNASRILQYSDQNTSQQLQNAVVESSTNWISLDRLNQIAILILNQNNVYSCKILLKNVHNNAGIQTVNYSKSSDNLDTVKNDNQQIVLAPTNQSKSDSAQPANISSSGSSSNVNLKQSPSNQLTYQAASTYTTQNTSSLQTPSPPPSNTLIFSKSQVPNTRYTGLILTHQLPTTFLTKQIYQVRGSVYNPATTSDGTYVNFILRGRSTSSRYAFYAWLDKGVRNFKIQVDFRTVPEGEYLIAIFQGSTGAPLSTVYKVISSIPTTQINSQIYPSSPINFNILYQENNLLFNWNQDNLAGLKKIVFRQGQLMRQYILSNFRTSFEVQFRDFAQFKQNIPVSVSLSSAYSLSNSFAGIISQFSPQSASQIIFNPVRHHFSQFKEAQIQLYQELPWRVLPKQKITLRGKALKNLQNRIVVEQPSKTFKQFFFNSQNKSATITAGTVFSLQISFTQTGPHILEINNVDGAASINRPIYVGDGYPLLPDFNDLNSANNNITSIINGQLTNLNVQRSILLRLINEKRTEFGVQKLVQDPELNRFSQAYTDDMVARRFYGHYNPQGQGVQQRARRFNITTAIGQNVAFNINFTDAHYRLCRSPIHLEYIVDKQWVKLGLGISRNSDQYFYVAQHFGSRDYSTNPLTNTQIQAIKTKLVSYILSSYNSVLKQNTQLSSAISDWQNLPSTAQSSQSIVAFLNSRGFRQFSIGNIKVNYTPSIVQNIKNTQYLQPDKPNANQVGLSLKLINGWMEIFVAYL